MIVWLALHAFPFPRCARLHGLAASLVFAAVPSARPGRSALVTASADGRLSYQPYTERGDVLPDFSHCGFGGGGVALPDAVVKETLEPRADGDGSARIQAALDRVEAVEGNRVTVGAPIACAIDAQWGGGALGRTNDERIERCGVESLRAVSVFDASKTAQQDGEKVFTDEEHASHVVAFGAVKNSWLRRVTSVHFWHGPAEVSCGAKWITVEDCRSLAPISVITGSRRYPYSVNGQLVLIQRCYSDRARHAFVFGSRVPGPNGFLECRSEHDYATSEPHHRWSVGGLYDNVEAPIAIQDRQWLGTGHGWAGANYVVWNCNGSLICQKPPTAQNFAIGQVGPKGEPAFERPDGWWESTGTPVEPRSLYQAQLAARR